MKANLRSKFRERQRRRQNKGRIYDPVIGRFLQADPIIQAPHNAQSHNRYSYVMNNPLSFTDPSGFGWWAKHRRQVIGIVAGILTAAAATWAMGAYALANGATMFAAAGGGLTKVGMIAAAAAGGFASDGIHGGDIQSALRGAFMAGLTAGVLQGIGGLGGEVPVATPEIARGPGIQHLANGAEHVQSGAQGMQVGVGVSDAVLPHDLVDSVVLTGATDPSWFSRSLDWLANGPTDRNTFGGAVWMGMMASSGGRVGGVARASAAASGAGTFAECLAAQVKAGGVGEDYLARRYGGAQQVSRQTSLGLRRIDNLSDVALPKSTDTRRTRNPYLLSKEKPFRILSRGS